MFPTKHGLPQFLACELAVFLHAHVFCEPKNELLDVRNILWAGYSDVAAADVHKLPC